MRYVIKTTNYNLYYKRNEDLIIYSNSIYNDNRNNRKLIYVLGFNLIIANIIETVGSALATMIETVESVLAIMIGTTESALAIMGCLAHST